jgi:folate-binding protein YgfZ
MTDDLNVLLEQQQQLNKSIDCTQTGFAVLPDWQALLVTGEDAEVFLQNLLTNDVKAAQPGQAQLNAFCQAKGRILAIFWLVRRGNDFILLLPADQADFLAQRLTMFKLRSKVDVTVMANCLIIALPNNHDHTGISAKIGAALAIALLPAEDIDSTLTQLHQTGLDQQASHCWQQVLLNNGYPMIFAASRERFTAQQVNLDLAGGVSFRKGCYPGQEVVARLHYLGEAKRRLFIGEVASTELPPPGTDINNPDGEVAGQLVQSCPIDSERSLVQLTLKLSMTGQNLFLPDHIEISGLNRLGSD